MTAYDRQAEAVRRRTVDHAMRQGWVLTDYFYNQLGPMEHDGISLKDNIGPMVYGMDVDRERHARPADRLPSRRPRTTSSAALQPPAHRH